MNFGDDDDIDDDDENEYDPLYESYKNYIPEQYRDSFDDTFEIGHFMYHVYLCVMRELTPSLKKLMWQQYPVFNTEKRPKVLAHLDFIAATIGHHLLINLYHLVEGQKAGVIIREKYPRFDSWVEFYARPQHPRIIDESNRSELYSWMSDEEWEVYRDKENGLMLEFFNWKEKRKFDFVDLVQGLLLKYYKELEKLNHDEWIIYAVFIRDEYETYLINCEDTELFIDCGWPEELVGQTYEEFKQNYQSLSQEIRDKTTELRNRRIAGEVI